MAHTGGAVPGRSKDRDDPRSSSYSSASRHGSSHSYGHRDAPSSFAGSPERGRGHASPPRRIDDPPPLDEAALRSAAREAEDRLRSGNAMAALFRPGPPGAFKRP